MSNSQTLKLMVSNCPGARLYQDGTPLTLTDGHIELNNLHDGIYVFKLAGEAGIEVEFAVKIDTDFTPPDIKLPGNVTTGDTVNGNVRLEIVGGDGDIEITVIKDGADISKEFEGLSVEEFKRIRFRENGHYVVTISQYGYETTKEFTIEKKLTDGYVAASVAAAPAASFGAILLALLRKKKLF